MKLRLEEDKRRKRLSRQHTSTLGCTGKEQSRSCESEAIPDPCVKHTNAPAKGERNPEPRRKKRCRRRGPAPVSIAGRLKNSHCACATLMRSITGRKQSLGIMGVSVVTYSEAAVARTAEVFSRIPTMISSTLYFLSTNIPSTWAVFRHSPASIPRCNVTSVCSLDWDWRKGQFESFLFGLPYCNIFYPRGHEPRVRVMLRSFKY